MSNLAEPTRPAWVRRVLGELDALLVDHAHCERKAAATAVKLLTSYPHHAFLQQPLSRLAREELRHFEDVLALLAARGIDYTPQRPSPYAARLHEAVRVDEPGRLVDVLLCSALIEARSCERFGLLAGAVPDAGLARFYAGLREAEARHHDVYVELARALRPEAEIRARLAELAAHEAAALSAAPPRPRMHG